MRTVAGLPPGIPELGGRIVVVAAHPDDECLALGGVLQELRRLPGELRIVVATDGEAAYPELHGADRAELARTRRRELHAALRVHGLATVPVTWLGLPDSALISHEEALSDRLRALLTGATATVAPWPRDPHPDHQAVGRATARTRPPRSRMWSYPIWMWHWMHPDEEVIPWRRAVLHRLSPARQDRKNAALAEFVSQLVPPPGIGGAVLPPEVLAHFGRGVEVLFREHP
ncbi:PIG-L deacetylase family protein [Actinopolyspora sp. H202]|uniref:PIG-L deacetylase family protein n=1 Tax=Actinopolyspora sp. H202 TaxID=1500456 RepID=UPI003EE7932B